MDEDIRLNKRNLLITSFIIFFYYYSGAEVKDINLIGVKADITNKEALISVGWMVFAYFFIKYLQYFICFGYGIVSSELNKSLNSDFAHSVLGLSKHEFDGLSGEHFLKSTAVRFRMSVPWAGMNKVTYHKKQRRRSAKGINFLRYSLSKYHFYKLVIKSIFTLHLFSVQATFKAENDHEVRKYYYGFDALKIICRIVAFAVINPLFTEHVVPLIGGVLLVAYVLYI